MVPPGAAASPRSTRPIRGSAAIRAARRRDVGVSAHGSECRDCAIGALCNARSRMPQRRRLVTEQLSSPRAAAATLYADPLVVIGRRCGASCPARSLCSTSADLPLGDDAALGCEPGKLGALVVLRHAVDPERLEQRV